MRERGGERKGKRELLQTTRENLPRERKRKKKRKKKKIPSLRHDHPLNLSISLSGGKENNNEGVSNGE